MGEGMLLDGLRVVEVSTALTGAQVGQVQVGYPAERIDAQRDARVTLTA